MVTRLDRLFLLLDTGSTPLTRKAAAAQLGEVQKLHSHELHNLLAKVHAYLKSTNWDTRIASGQAVEAIVKNVPQWQPAGTKIKDEPGTPDASRTPTPVQRDTGRLEFSQFEISRVLQRGTFLAGSAGTEYETSEEASDDPKEKLAKQRRLLQKRLGLDIAGNALGFQTDELFNDADLEVRTEDRSKAPQPLPADIVSQEMQAMLKPGMSSREKNRAKRRAKLMAKQRSKDKPETTASTSETTEEEPLAKKARTSTVVVSQPSQSDKVVLDHVVDSSVFYEEAGEWPFASFCEQLSTDLFNQSWVVRHGAATGLREVIKVHGKSSGKTSEYPVDQQDSLNQMWLEDMALRLLCVLALDRFGDFVSDEVVAPVRETCAQTLGVVLHHMNVDGVKTVLSILLQLLSQQQWEARHGGLLGIKYLLAVTKEMTDDFLPLALSSVIHGLQDVDDDVRAVAAAALIPVAESLLKIASTEVPVIIQTLWDTLLELDDLTASTNSIMTLLSTLACKAPSRLQQSLTELVPRLWPFLRHNIASVRKSALETLYTLLNAESSLAACQEWLSPILQEALRHVYQRCILEDRADILELVEKVWSTLLAKAHIDYLIAAACPWISAWLCLIMQPANLPIDPHMLIEAKHKTKEKSPRGKASPGKEENHHVAGNFAGVPAGKRDYKVTQTRHRAAKLLGLLAVYITDSRLPAESNAAESIGQLLSFHLDNKSALQRVVVGLVVTEWAIASTDCRCPELVKAKLMEDLCSSVYYDEVAVPFMRLQTECQVLVNSWCECNRSIQRSSFPNMFTVEQAGATAQGILGQLTQIPLPARTQQSVHDKCQQVLGTISEINTEQQKLNTRVQAVLAGAIVALKCLPDKLNPIIKPLMETIKTEENPLVQHHAASSLARLLHLCVDRVPCPNPKVIRNLCGSLCSDSSHTPNVTQPVPSLNLQEPGGSSNSNGSRPSTPVTAPISWQCDKSRGILTLVKQQQTAILSTLPRRGPHSSRNKHIVTNSTNLDEIIYDDDNGKMSAVVQRRGASYALTTLVGHFGESVVTKLNKVWEAMTNVLFQHIQPENFDPQAFQNNDNQAQELVNSLQVYEVLASVLHTSLHPKLLETLPHLCVCLEYPYTAVRYMVARCLGVLSKVVTMDTMTCLIDKVLPLLSASENEIKRQGAIEAISNVIEMLGLDIIPYIVLLVVPVLGRMSDSTESIRLMATHCFATLIRLMPLEGGMPDPPRMTAELSERKVRERNFLEQLLDSSKLDNYKVPVPIKAELRKYQQDGVNWLSFLNKYKLHGILCDDMGLGKTLQSICIMAGDQYERAQMYKKFQSADSAPLPCLVVCPPTLTGHWVYEIEKFVSPDYLSPLHYTGPPAERTRLRSKVKKHNLVVASYDIVRNDIDFFRGIDWNYCILDEGHIIKNGKTKLSKAVKQLNVNHRVILSGTPIQNNVLELWSLFDFLMPGFLGTEKQFTARFAKPILQSRDAKSSSKEQEAGALAMESLHRQVLPFLLRRLKEDVLDDLPPKIIQDYYCELSPLQVQLYEDFSKSRARKGVEQTISMGNDREEDTSKKQGFSHVFQALQYLRKVCDHPLLVLTPQHPQYENITQQLAEQHSSLHDLQHAPKLIALKQLLQDCGIGVSHLDGQQGELTESVVGQHRILLFCQLKSMLDIVEKDLLQGQMPDVTYLRLDGSVPAGARHEIVHRFNNDPSIDILLLTTHVGGLGLNLTGADTVIFVEHDWNPMRDLQAMDRAHRIGQKKVVNVYRLITRGTLEEKIMGLQKFKLNIANTVISQENASLQSMGTDQMLELFALDKKESRRDGGQEAKEKSKSGMRAVMEELGELWEEEQYETEYDLGNFLNSLHH
ncbi:TATA-binding protein-associated factor 172-like [Ptychodera flava]|uniref:TATA-binding protein-associated factor 172-like n=1 Tax=Ptychodera flava TaxID=63121 RepID=UPI003969D1D3